MAYFADMSAYQYMQTLHWPYFLRKAINIGWLDARHEFVVGDVPQDFVDALFDHCCLQPVRKLMGNHECGICISKGMSPQSIFSHNGKQAILGDAEIEIPFGRSRLFVAPTLIFHYVRDHAYRPPDDFVKAVLARRDGRRKRGPG